MFSEYHDIDNALHIHKINSKRHLRFGAQWTCGKSDLCRVNDGNCWHFLEGLDGESETLDMKFWHSCDRIDWRWYIWSNKPCPSWSYISTDMFRLLHTRRYPKTHLSYVEWPIIGSGNYLVVFPTQVRDAQWTQVIEVWSKYSNC